MSAAPATVEDLCAWTQGEIVRGRDDQTFTGTKIDSREVASGDLFVAIVGPNHDAHRFLGDVMRSGAAGALVQMDRIEETIARTDGFLVHVDDTTAALAALAQGHRESFEGPLVGMKALDTRSVDADRQADVAKQQPEVQRLQDRLGLHRGLIP